jgi:flagellar biosynthesis protein FlhG
MAPRHEPDDQAAGLRRLLGGQHRLNAVGLLGPDPLLTAQAAANLAYALNRRGSRVCLIDEAPGPHNATGQFGISADLTLADVLKRRGTLDDALAQVADGLLLLPATRGLSWAAMTDERDWNRLAGDLVRMEPDWLLIAAQADDRATLALATPFRILVLPAQRNRLTEAYAVLKATHHRQPDARWSALCMQVEMDGAEQSVAALNETTRRFLGIDVGLLGAIPRDVEMDRSLRTMRLILEATPSSPAATALRQVAEQVVGQATQLDERIETEAFWRRLGLLGRLNRERIPRKPAVSRGRAYG